MMVLAEHRAEISHLPHQPLCGLHMWTYADRHQLPSFVRKIKQYGAGLEDRNWISASLRLAIHDRGDPIVRGNL